VKLARVWLAVMPAVILDCSVFSGLDTLGVDVSSTADRDGAAPPLADDGGPEPDSSSTPIGDDAALADAADSPADGGTDSPADVTSPPPPIKLVHYGTLPRHNGKDHTISFEPTTAGNLMVVVVAQESGSTITVGSLHDSANSSYVSANQRSVDTSCNDSIEIWYASARAGATSATISMSATGNIEAWTMEFSGLAKGGTLDVGAVTNNQTGNILDAPRVTPSVERALVISSTMSCGDATSLRTTSFQALPLLSGQTAAWFVASTRGAYGASWNATNDTWNATTVAFR
jgi:hypothetical protein